MSRALYAQVARHFALPLMRGVRRQMEIRVLTGRDANQCRLLRLEGLRDFPTAFAASYDEEREVAVGTVGERLEPSESGAVFGAIDQFLRGDWPAAAEKVTKLDPREKGQ